MPEHSDDNHCKLANSFIKIFNTAMQSGYSVDFVASAAMSASAAYTVHNITRSGEQIQQADLDRVTGIYMLRLLDFLKQNCPDQLPPEMKNNQ